MSGSTQYMQYNQWTVSAYISLYVSQELIKVVSRVILTGWGILLSLKGMGKRSLKKTAWNSIKLSISVNVIPVHIYGTSMAVEYNYQICRCKLEFPETNISTQLNYWWIVDDEYSFFVMHVWIDVRNDMFNLPNIKIMFAYKTHLVNHYTTKHRLFYYLLLYSLSTFTEELQLCKN